MKIKLISLGCPKNLVDSEVILGKLGERGHSFTSWSNEADIIIINTCSFIKEARGEAYAVISRAIREKGISQRIVVCGCLPQLEKRELFHRYPEIDALLGSADFHEIDGVVDALANGASGLFSVNAPRFLYNSSFPRLLATPPSYAYLKIAEGCSNRCSYCLVPQLRGKYRSRPIDDIVKEARALVGLGVRELILIAQDTTFYGRDLSKKASLTRLIERLETMEKLKWVRLLYTHPAHLTLSLIRTMASLKRVCRYIDLPLQHTHNEILARMRRPQFKVAERLINQLRERIPEIAIRTTLLLGFPGERESHFQKLLKDVEKFKFDWVGALTYSPERDTSAYSLGPKVPSSVKGRRYRELMKIQRSITCKKNERFIGKDYLVLVDGKGEGHTEFQCPGIDGKIFLEDGYKPGEMLLARVSGVKDYYDLTAEKKETKKRRAAKSCCPSCQRRIGQKMS